MKLLAIDTTGAYSSVALYDDGKIYQKINDDDFSHLQRLIPVVNEVLENNNCSPKELDAIAVSRGPGSFTGIRIGMASAKGLAQIWNKPIVCVPTLASFAFRPYSFEAEGQLYCPVFDAKRHQIYGGAYEKNSDISVVPDGAYDLDEYLSLLKEKASAYKQIVFFGDGIKAYAEGLKNSGLNCIFAEDKDLYQTAEGAANLGVKLFNEGLVFDCYTAQPEYLRAAEAERKLAEKIKADADKFGTSKSNKLL